MAEAKPEAPPDLAVSMPANHEKRMTEVADEKTTVDSDNVEAHDVSSGEVDDLHKPATTLDVVTHTVHLKDDVSLPAITFRSVFLGVGLSVFGGVLSAIYYFKPQTVVIATVFLAILAFLLGELMAFCIPRWGPIGRFLNPGPFNIKEHVAITIMANSASISAIGLEILAVERLYYGKELNAAISIFLLISSQYLGYGMAGLLRKTLVYPVSMLWPSNLPVASMMENLHLRSDNGKKGLRIFLIIFTCIFFYEILPQWIMPLLTGVSVFCLANRNSQLFTNLFGGAQGNEGLGILSLCFDWQYISGGTSPLYYPLESLISQGLGIAGCIVLFAGLYYGNVWNALQFPMLSQLIFSQDSTPGNAVQYNQTAVIGLDNKIDPVAVAQFGLPNFAASNVLNVLVTNMCTTAGLVHLILWYPKECKMAFGFLDPRKILTKVSRIFKERQVRKAGFQEMQDNYDPHYALMKSYKVCPDWWYGLVLLLSAIISFVVIYKAESTLPWWEWIVAFILGFILLVIFGSLQAITGVRFTIQSVVQMIAGYIQPGNPVSNMYFSLYSYNALLQGVLMAQDLKLAQYIHLAPQITFWVQMAGTLIGTLLNYVIANSIITQQFDILKSVEGTNIWSGNQPQQFNAQAVAFGGFPHELFSVGGRYQWTSLATLLGFITPVPFWLAHKKWPNAGFDLINTPVILFYFVYLNVGINSSVMNFFIVGFIAQGYIRRRYPNLFVKYNYLISAALDGGTAVMVFILSFAVQGTSGRQILFPNYWGNPAGTNIDYCYQASSAGGGS